MHPLRAAEHDFAPHRPPPAAGSRSAGGLASRGGSILSRDRSAFLLWLFCLTQLPSSSSSKPLLQVLATHCPAASTSRARHSSGQTRPDLPRSTSSNSVVGSLGDA